MAEGTADRGEKEMNNQKDIETCQTIIDQLGGRRFVMLTGAKLYRDGSSLIAKVRGGKFVRIDLDEGADLYNVTGYKVKRAPSFEKIVTHTYEGVFCDQLQDLFCEITGLFTSF